MSSTSGNFSADGNVSAGGTLTGTGASTQAAVSADSLQVGTETGYSDYSYFEADGTNRPTVTSFRTYDFGAGALKNVYLYNGTFYTSSVA